MRRAALTLIAASISSLTVSAAVTPPAMAGAMAYCIKGCDFGGGAGDCSFSSLAQCQATASGRFLQCIANPYYVSESEPPPSAYRPLPGRTLPPAPGSSRY